MNKTSIKMLLYILFALLYIANSVYLTQIGGLFIHSAIVWNLFLAVLPLLCSIIYTHTASHHQVIHILSFIAWLLLFPNAPYMITDFIHLAPLSFYEFTATGSIYLQNIFTWIQLLHIALGVFIGVLTGFKSLSIIHDDFKKRFPTYVVAILMVFIFLSTGYGVFLGRFLRLNSWDILHPITLFLQIISQTNLFAILFSITFAIFLGILYTFYRSLSQKKNPQCEDSSII